MGIILAGCEASSDCEGKSKAGHLSNEADRFGRDEAQGDTAHTEEPSRHPCDEKRRRRKCIRPQLKSLPEMHLISRSHLLRTLNFEHD